MRYVKRVVAKMALCYAIGMFRGADADSFVIGTEKRGPIRRFSLAGEPMETLAAGPGGVMTIAQVPGRSDQLLATSGFFSPNFGGDDARIVRYARGAGGSWTRAVVCDLPYVHRFGMLRGADGRLWLIACTIKGACRPVKDDWRSPGAVYVALLDDGEASADTTGCPRLIELSGAQLQNHGLWVAPDASFALISTAAGVFRYVPPADANDRWGVTCLIVQPTSDICMADFDGDGTQEILTFSAFHGSTARIWHEGSAAGTYECVWTDPQRREFLHAIWGGMLAGTPCAIVGNRRGDRDLLRVFFGEDGYQVEAIDHDCGPANCCVFRHEGQDRIIATNREIDEVAIYTVTR